MPIDDLGTEVPIYEPAARVVSLVPSLTEAIAATRPEALVGATDWCTHPADLDVTRVRGTKNPDRAGIEALSPDLVIVNREENRKLDVERLRAAGVPVWVTVIETVEQSLESMGRLFTEGLGWGRPDWLDRAADLWAEPVAESRGMLAVPIWRDPWMVVGPDTFTTDLLRRLGWRNAFDAGSAVDPDRYPHVDLAAIDAADVDLVLLPDEPYVFSETDGPEAFTTARTELVSGRLLTWYGPSLIEAREVLSQIR
jgi:ABC-type Fe3+-hydroxamate transport system substrate-binding protein